ncbi:hypothetical protein QVD17_20727 [Tagetes erecta]|uniref:Secreted protein n=1 Tax=Tagetes erecta TaxID=13708 RepID=A0AAD8KLQ1_TARER|nr:hypothetical protein QVD17_20727 [Tagetes erecta]
MAKCQVLNCIFMLLVLSIALRYGVLQCSCLDFSCCLLYLDLENETCCSFQQATLIKYLLKLYRFTKQLSQR